MARRDFPDFDLRSATDRSHAQSPAGPIVASPVVDSVPWNSPSAREIGFNIPAHYNASEILFQNLAAGRGELLAVTGPAVAFDPKSAARTLQDYVKRKLVPYKYPRVVQFMPALPKTGTGKIDRQALLDAITSAGEPAADIGERSLAPISRSNRGRPLRKQGGRP